MQSVDKEYPRKERERERVNVVRAAIEATIATTRTDEEKRN